MPPVLPLYFAKLFTDFFGLAWVRKSLIFIAVLGAALLVVKCGYDQHQEYKRITENTKAIVANVRTANENLTKTVASEKASGDINTKIVEETFEQKQRLKDISATLSETRDKSLNKARVTHAKKLAKVKEKKLTPPQEKEEIDKIDQQRDVELSKANIAHLWSVYCTTTNQAGPACVSSA